MLLASLGVAHAVRPVDVPEVRRPGEAARDYVLRLAREKAGARAEPGELVVAADTVVVFDDEVLEKPADPADARRMLARLAGRWHSVLTGVALFEPGAGRRAAAVDESRVRIATLSDDEIAWYVDTGEPMDKAGSYAIQDLGAMFVETVEGNYTNVVGLPLPTLYRLVVELGHDLRNWMS